MSRFHPDSLHAQLDLFDPSGSDPTPVGILDSHLLAAIIRFPEYPTPGPEEREKEGIRYYRADRFFVDLSQRGPLATSYVTLFETLDPKRQSGSDPNKPVDALGETDQRRMSRRISEMKRLGIYVLPITGSIFSRALDIWFDSRLGRLGEIRDAALMDPLIAATSFEYGIPLYSSNARHFEPLLERYPFDFQKCLQFDRYFRLRTP
jgi:predicted nucleic acid-binding protein